MRGFNVRVLWDIFPWVFLASVHFLNKSLIAFVPKCLFKDFLNLFIIIFFVFLGPFVQHMEVPRLGAKSELPAYATATAMSDPSCVCDLHHSSRWHQILNPLNEARDRTRILVDTSRVPNPLSHNRNPVFKDFSMGTEPWKMEKVSPSRTEERFVCCPGW